MVGLPRNQLCKAIFGLRLAPCDRRSEFALSILLCRVESGVPVGGASVFVLTHRRIGVKGVKDREILHAY